MSLCDSCNQRHLCSDLCPEAELFASQDQVYEREKTIGLPRYGKFPASASNIPLTPMQKKIVTLLGQGLNRADVCQVLKISNGSLRAHIKRLKKKL